VIECSSKERDAIEIDKGMWGISGNYFSYWGSKAFLMPSGSITETGLNRKKI